MVMAMEEEQWIYPVFREKGWQKKGACHGDDPNVYIPEKKDSKDTTHYDKSTCMACCVRLQCLDYALANRAKKGLWGGTTPKQREKMYSLYQGEREHELDLEWQLFPRKLSDADLLLADEAAKTARNIIRFPLAVNSPLYFSWVPEIYVQCTLFDNTQYQVSKVS